MTRICRRDQRSMNTPANGPISEYGRYSTVNAAAAAAGLVNVSALKNTYVPIPAVMMPSPVWEISRTVNSRRKFRSASTMRRSETKADRVSQPNGLLRPRPGPRSACWDTPSAYGARVSPGDTGARVGCTAAPRVPAARPKPRCAGAPRDAGARRSALYVAPDELVHQVAGDVVAVLLGRRLHEVRRGRENRPADPAVAGDLRGADGVDDHPGGVRRVPDLEPVLQVQRHVAEGLALEPDGRPLHLVRDLRRDRLRLGDLLGLEPAALQHVHEVHVAADVELVRAQQLHPAV